MEDEFEVPEAELRPNVAMQLKEAREAAGMTIKDIAVKTRVPIRHLENLEAENFGALPGLTYVLGFVRNYARALELDEDELVRQQRAELSDDDRVRRHYADPSFAPADPARIPPKWFAWGGIAVLVAVMLIFGVIKLMSSGIGTDVVPTSADTTETTPVAAPTAPAATSAATGPVVLTATEEVWLRIYTEDGKRLLEKGLQKGETFTIPDDVEKPLLLTGRPQALTATVGGKPIPQLAPADRTVSDLDISAATLLARAAQENATDGAAAPPAPTPAN